MSTGPHSKPERGCFTCHQNCKIPEALLNVQEAVIQAVMKAIKRRLSRMCIGNRSQFHRRRKAKCGKDGSQYLHYPLLCKESKDEKLRIQRRGVCV